MVDKSSKPGLLRLLEDPLFRLLAVNGAAGICVAFLVLGGIFWSNIGNLRVLVLNAEDPVLPVLMLAFALVITLVSVVVGSAIMLLGETGRGGGTSFRLPPLRLGQQRQQATVTVTAGSKGSSR